jgi:hypothetical protein
MAHTLGGTLVREVFEDDGERSVGYVPIDPDIERNLAVVLMSAVRTLDNQEP